MRPFFSIIIPVYNVALYLRECLDSVLAQTFTDWEAICIDDGSTDGSGTILDEYAVKDKRFCVVHRTNFGVGAARNAALEIAKGKWIWFVDGDDAIHPQALGWLNSVIAIDNTAESVGFYHGNLDGEMEPKKWPELPSLDSVRVLRLRDSVAFKMHRRAAWGTIIRGDKIGDLRFKKYIVGEDAVFNMTYFWKTSRWILAEAPVYFYRRREGSAMQQRVRVCAVYDSIDAEIDMLGMLIKHECDIDKFKCREYLEWNACHVYETLARQIADLSNSDKEKVVGRWVQLQYMQNQLYMHLTAWRCLVLFIVSTINAPKLFRTVVIELPSLCNRILNGLKRRMGR